MDRVTEPELMVDDDQALAYSEADFAESHQAAVTRFAEAFPDFRSGRMLDLACGPADITVRFARAYPETTIVGLEGSPAMLALGVQRLRARGTRPPDLVRAPRAAGSGSRASSGGSTRWCARTRCTTSTTRRSLWDAIGVGRGAGRAGVRPGPHAPGVACRGPGARRPVRARRARGAPPRLLQLAAAPRSPRPRSPSQLRGRRLRRLHRPTRHRPPPDRHRPRPLAQMESGLIWASMPPSTKTMLPWM